MKTIKKFTVELFILIFFLQTICISVFAAVNPPQPAPEKLIVKALHDNPPSDVQPPIGYNVLEGGASGFYVDLCWDPLKSPGAPIVAENKYINIYAQEVTKPYKPAKAIEKKISDLSGSITQKRLDNLNSGTIYYINAKAYYTYSDGNTTYTSGESAPSNTIKALSDIVLNAYSYGTNQIKIEWDDVWNSGQRIDYKLYVSEDSSFANTSPIFIGQSQIGTDGPVTVNEATGKLEYIHQVRDPGRVYYVKIQPDIAEPGLYMTKETQTVAASSYILVKTTRMSATDTESIWRFDWSPVVTGLINTDININYEVDKFVNNVPIPMLLESGTNTFISIPTGQETNYYLIRALVTKKNGDPLYGNVRIQSDRIIVKDEEVPSYPVTPELVDRLDDSYYQPIVSYEDIFDNGQLIRKGELTPIGTSILWRASKKANGLVDSDITYDMWLINNPDMIDFPPDNTKIASNVKMTDKNFIMDGTKLIGYKFPITNLTPNSTYYFKIVAKKVYVENINNSLQSVEYASEAALKIIITPTDGPINQPRVPARPPLRVKKASDGKDMIKETEATVQLKNLWYEKYNQTTKQWEYVRTEKLNDGDTPPYIPTQETLDDKQYRMVSYDSGVTIDVGCIKYTDGMSYNDLSNILANKVMGFPITANDSTEDKTLNFDNQRHNIDIKITDLDPNSTYVIWVRATRKTVNLTSGPSDPIVITTDPIEVHPVEKPTIPVFNYNQVGDTYVDLGWEFKPAYNYYIKYGTEDNINSASGSIAITPQDLSDASYYRIKGLNKNTLYYFWIQSEATVKNPATNEVLTSQSDWSDSYPLKTLPEIPPNTPRGFGVKNTQDAITKNSITFEWLKGNTLEYVLEVASGIDYKDVKEYKVGSVSEFKVDGLRSNYRYYARLYAFDPANNTKSEPTQSVTVRTKRSSDDYDSNQDIENIVIGDYVVKEAVAVGGTWNVKITGVNADRFVEHLIHGSSLDYKLDVSKPPLGTDIISMTVSNRVFDTMTDLKRNLVIATGESQLIIRPGMLTTEMVSTPSRSLSNFHYEIRVSSDAADSISVKNTSLKTRILGIAIRAFDGSNNIDITTMRKPLKVLVPYTDIDWFKEGTTSAYVYDPSLDTWDKVETQNSYDEDNNQGYVSFETLHASDMAVVDSGNDYFDDIYGNQYENSITNVESVYPLKSIRGRLFEPGKNITIAEAVKFMLDVLEYNYSNDYMAVAQRSGIIQYEDLSKGGTSCTKEKLAAMVVRMYEIKSGKEAVLSGNNTPAYSDIGQVDPLYLAKVRFALENGIVGPKGGGALAPKDPVTRGETVFSIEKVLALVGELD